MLWVSSSVINPYSTMASLAISWQTTCLYHVFHQRGPWCTQQRIFGSIQIGKAKAQQYPWVSTSNHQRSWNTQQQHVKTPRNAMKRHGSPRQAMRSHYPDRITSTPCCQRSLQHCLESQVSVPATFQAIPKTMEVAKIWRNPFLKWW